MASYYIDVVNTELLNLDKFKADQGSLLSIASYECSKIRQASCWSCLFTPSRITETKYLNNVFVRPLTTTKAFERFDKLDTCVTPNVGYNQQTIPITFHSRVTDENTLWFVIRKFDDDKKTSVIAVSKNGLELQDYLTELQQPRSTQQHQTEYDERSLLIN